MYGETTDTHGKTGASSIIMKRVCADFVLVIDIEATCWERPPPAGQVSDIIETGLRFLDTTTGNYFYIYD